MLSDYHIWQIPCAVKDAEIGVTYSDLENELGGGFYSQILYGSENGEKYWNLTMPTLTGTTDRTVTSVGGETLTYEEYVWDLYQRQRADGTAFAYRCPRNQNYYLARFANAGLSYNRMLTKLYSSGIQLKQWRIPGETVFEPAQVSQVWGSYDPIAAEGPFGQWWPATAPNTTHLEFISGDVVSGTSGTLPIVRFSLTADDGILTSSQSLTVKEVYALMKIREATFGNDDGILTSSVGTTFLNGKSGTDEFYNLGLSGTHTHELDGIAYPQSAAKAPMNQWGIVHVRNTVGVAISNLQLGADRGFVGRHAELDIAYLIIADELIPKTTQREIYEFLSILKGKLV